MENNSIEQLNKMDCASYGGTNCVLRGCMVGCVLEQAKRKVLKEKGMTDAEIDKEINGDASPYF